MKSSHDNLESTLADATHGLVHLNDMNKALPIGVAYAHAVCIEDMVIGGMLTHNKSVVMENPDNGLSEQMPSFAEWDKHEAWAKSVQVDMEKFKAYAQNVYQTTEAYLGTITDEDLDQEIEIPGMGKHIVSGILSNFIILHNSSLTGEISAAKGFQGHKGYAF